MLVSIVQGATPVTVYVKVEVVAPIAGVKVPARASKVPPVPVPVRVQTPPDCSPVIKLNKFMAVGLVSQTEVLPSVPAVGWTKIFTEATLESDIQGADPDKVYVKVEFVAPTAGVYVPARASKTPPVPVPVRVQTPPGCSPEIKLNKFITAELVSQTVVLPSSPASGCPLMVTVATLTSLTQGDVPETVYSNVEVVAPAVGANVPATALKIPPVPVPVRVQTPPVCSPVIKLNKSIAVVVLAQITVPPSDPAVGCGIIFTEATLVSVIHGAVPDNV